MKKTLIITTAIVFVLFGCEKNNPPACEIISPENAAKIISGELVIFSVDAHDSDGSIQEVVLYIDNIEIASVTDLPYDFSWESADAELGRHNIRAVAIDNEKGEAEAGIVIDIYEAPPDIENPLVELITPIEDSTVTGTITLVAKALDNSGVEYVDFRTKDEDWVIFEKDSTPVFFEYSASLNTNNYPDGLRMLSLAAYDAAGNSGEYSFNVYINNTGDDEAPIVELLAPQNNDTVSGHVVLRAKVTDNVGIDHVNFNVLKGTWVLLDTDYYAINENEYAILWDTKSIPDGRYGIEAAAFDAVGHEGNDQIGITIDNSGSRPGDDSFIYESRKYHYKTIGTQTWMIDNLAYWPTGGSSGGSYRVYDQSSDRDIARHSDNYNVYGVLYNWKAAQTACPPGWHLPSDEEWKTLEKNLGMSSSDADNSGFRNSGDVGRKLKSTSGWVSNGTGDNSSGFNALPGGYRDIDGNGYVNLGSYANFWSSSTMLEEDAFCRYLRKDSDGVYRSAVIKKYYFSVRCIKDE